MNAFPHLSDFNIPTHIIVGGTSQTGGMQKQLLEGHGDINVMSTGSKGATYNFGAGNNAEGGKNIVRDNTSLPLKDEKTINTGILGISDVAGDILVFGEPTHLTLHAMSISGVSKTYPKEVSNALVQVGAKIASVFYISYEDGASPENPNGSHVYYPVRETKQQMEQSALESCQDAKIIDLITFDSPSAKKLGFTFLGIVGDFVNFMESHSEHSLSQKFRPIIQEFLGENYTGIQQLFAEYPLRGELKAGQQSMKQMGIEGTLNAMIAEATKRVNFARFSRISGIITELYLLLAMNDMNQNRETILKQSGTRVLLDWERISKQDMENVLGDIDTIYQKLEGKIKQDDVSKLQQDGLYREVGKKEDRVMYTLDMQEGDFLKHHFGIHPYFLSLEMVKNSGLLNEDEYISVGKASSMLYTGNELTICRRGNMILLVNTENEREVFCEFEIKNKLDMKKPEASEKSYLVPTTDKSLDTQSFPHSQEWIEAFSLNIPLQFGNISFSRSSALIEHLGFKVGSFLLSEKTEEEKESLSNIFPAFKKVDFSKVQGKFSKIATEYEIPHMEDILSQGIPLSLKIVKFGYANGNISMGIELLSSEEVIGKYTLSLV